MPMIHSYSSNEPKKADIPKGHKVIKVKINGRLIYFVIESGNRPTKDLTGELTEHYMKKEKQKKDAIVHQYWYDRMCESQKGVFY
jgi:endo-beta-N-acetylglucosaminidase D